MENQEATQVMVYNGTEYALKDLSKNALECVTQLQDLQAKTYKARLELEQLTVAYNYFNALLGEELKSSQASSLADSLAEITK